MKAIAWVMSPINFIQCLIAHKKLQDFFGKKIDLEILHYYPSPDIAVTKEIFNAIQDIALNMDPSISCRFVDFESGTSVQALKKISLPESADFIFLAHDVVGNFFENLKEIYPESESVCYGDALGQFFQREVHLSYLQKGHGVWKDAKRLIHKITGRAAAHVPSAPKDYAVLTIPVSQAPFPRATTLIVPEKHIALETIASCTQNNALLTQYCNTIIQEIDEHKGNACLLMTENMSEGNFISNDTEINMYADGIIKNCAEGDLVYIKPHPGEIFDRAALLKEKLGNRYVIKKFNAEYKRYPIELFRPILEKCLVISMFYPALSLKYLYNIDVIQPMDDALIDRYFDKPFRKSYKNAIGLNMVPLGRLQGWNGKDLLYNGR